MSAGVFGLPFSFLQYMLFGNFSLPFYCAILRVGSVAFLDSCVCKAVGRAFPYDVLPNWLAVC